MRKLWHNSQQMHAKTAPLFCIQENPWILNWPHSAHSHWDSGQLLSWPPFLEESRDLCEPSLANHCLPAHNGAQSDCFKMRWGDSACKGAAAKPDDLNSVPRTHVVEGENWLQLVWTPTHVRAFVRQHTWNHPRELKADWVVKQRKKGQWVSGHFSSVFLAFSRHILIKSIQDSRHWSLLSGCGGGVGCPGAGCHGAQPVLGSWWSPCLSLPSTGISLMQYLNSFQRWLFNVGRVETVPPGGKGSPGDLLQLLKQNICGPQNFQSWVKAQDVWWIHSLFLGCPLAGRQGYPYVLVLPITLKSFNYVGKPPKAEIISPVLE